MTRWEELESLLENEQRQSQQRDDPIPLQLALVSLMTALSAFLALRKYLENPENRGLRSCLWCKVEFRPKTEWITTCSGPCERQWLQFPHLQIDRSIVDLAHQWVRHLDTTERRSYEKDT